MMSRKWARFTCEEGADWRALSGDARLLTVTIFRSLGGPFFDYCTDDELLDAYFLLIKEGLIDVYFRVVKGGVESTIRFPLGKSVDVAAARLGGSIH